jgi:protein-S-isoprenylcysteine O-methyltransferase Ste14
MVHQEDPFRLAVITVAATTMCVTAFHRVKANSGEPISRRQEGVAFAWILRLCGLLLGVTTVTYVISPSALAWASMPVPLMIRWTAVALALFCSVLMYWTLSKLGKNLTDTVITRSNAYLVTSGPYRWVRHPFYVTAALLMTSVTIIAANWLIGLLSINVLGLLAVRTPLEEQLLIERFGEQYRSYMACTGRFFPRLLRTR